MLVEVCRGMWVLAVLLGAGCIGAPSDDGVAQDVAVRTLEQGIDSGHDDRQRIAIADAEAWSAWNSEHRSNDGSLRDRPEMRIDWARETVLAVTTGPLASTCGESITVSRVSVREGVLEAEVTTAQDGSACMGSASHPFALVAVEHRGPVVFIDVGPTA